MLSLIPSARLWTVLWAAQCKGHYMALMQDLLTHDLLAHDLLTIQAGWSPLV